MPFVERGDADWRKHSRRLAEELLVTSLPDEERRKRYAVFPIPVNAADYGVPQVRYRVVIVGFRLDLGIGDELWNEKFRPKRTYWQAALFQQLGNPRSEYWKRHEAIPQAVRQRVIHAVPAVDPDKEEDLTLLPWRTLRDVITGDPDRGELPLPQTGLVDFEGHPELQAPSHWLAGCADLRRPYPQRPRPSGEDGEAAFTCPGGESLLHSQR